MPGTVRNAAAVPHSSGTQINLSWEAPESDGGSTITGYKYKIGQGTWSGRRTSTTVNVTGLTPGTNYTFSVIAVNSIGNGNAVSVSATTSAILPGRVRNATATVVSATQINLSWEAPESDGGSAIIGYKYWESVSENTVSVGSAILNVNLTGLTPSTPYEFIIYAYNSIGDGNAADAIIATTQAAAGGGGGGGSTTNTKSFNIIQDGTTDEYFAMTMQQATVGGRLALQSDFTIEFWFKMDEDRNSLLLTKEKSWHGQHGFRISATTAFAATGTYGGNYAVTLFCGKYRPNIPGPKAINANIWYHAAITRDSTTNVYTWYVTENCKSTIKTTQTTTIKPSDGASFQGKGPKLAIGGSFGRLGNTHGWGLIGNMSEIRIWGATLTEETITSYRYKSLDTNHPNKNTLLVYYKCNETDGNILNDTTSDINPTTAEKSWSSLDARWERRNGGWNSTNGGLLNNGAGESASSSYLNWEADVPNFGGCLSYHSYKSWRIIYLEAPPRIPYTCGIRFFDETDTLLVLTVSNVFRSGASGQGANNNWAEHQPGNLNTNWSAARTVQGNCWLGIHFGTEQKISKIHIGSTTAQYAAEYSWGSRLNKSSFPVFHIQGSNNADSSETGGRNAQMSGSWTTIMSVTESDLYEPDPITDTSSTATKSSSASFIQGNNLTMRIIDLPTIDPNGGG